MTLDGAAREMRSWEEFARSLRNYEWLGDVVPGAMDIDFLIERRGRFLVCEFKPWSNGVSVGFGQHLALDALSKLDTFDVVLVGEDEKAQRVYRCNYRDKTPVKKRTRPVWFPPEAFERTTRDALRIFVEMWYERASES